MGKKRANSALGWGLGFVWAARKSVLGRRRSVEVALVAERIRSGAQREGQFGIGVMIGVHKSFL